MIPDEKRRVAITRNIEAGGDPRILEAQAIAAENNPALKDTAEEYRGAKQLSDTEIEVRDEIRAKLAGDLAHLKHLGLLPEDGGKPNYMPHKWDVEDLDPDTGKPVTKTLVDGDRDMLKKRTFDTIAEGEQKGRQTHHEGCGGAIWRLPRARFKPDCETQSRGETGKLLHE